MIITPTTMTIQIFGLLILVMGVALVDVEHCAYDMRSTTTTTSVGTNNYTSNRFGMIQSYGSLLYPVLVVGVIIVIFSTAILLLVQCLIPRFH